MTTIGSREAGVKEELLRERRVFLKEELSTNHSASKRFPMTNVAKS
jgi:hypothetical protein